MDGCSAGGGIRRGHRQQAALAVGATDLINLLTENLEERTRELTDGRGADLVIECTGQPHIWEQSVNLSRRGGTVVFFGGCKRGTTVTFDTLRIHYDQITLLSPFHFGSEAVKTARSWLLEPDFDLEPLLSGERELEAGGEVFEDLRAERGVKYVFVP